MTIITHTARLVATLHCGNTVTQWSEYPQPELPPLLLPSASANSIVL